MNLAMQLLVAGHSSTADGELTPPGSHSTNPFWTTDGGGKWIINWSNGDGVFSGCETDVFYNGSIQATPSADTPGADRTHATNTTIQPTDAQVRHRDPNGRVSEWVVGGEV